MSRAGLRIRKLISQGRTWPNPEDDHDGESAFECSSAKTIRVQYELEQYQQQQQQIQKDLRQQHRCRSSWMSSNSSPKEKGRKNIPMPITVVRRGSDGFVVRTGSGSTRLETPLPLSSLTGLTSPGTPDSSYSSEDSLCSCRGGDCNQQHQHRLPNSKRAATAMNAMSANFNPPRLTTPTITAEWSSPDSALCSATTPNLATKKSWYEEQAFGHATAITSSNPDMQGGDHCVAISHQPTPTPTTTTTTTTTTTNYSRKQINRTATPTTTNSSCTTVNPPNRRLNTMQSHTQEDAKDGQARGRETLEAAQSTSILSFDGGEKAFGGFDEDSDELPDNVQQLIWETDEAFKAVGKALAEARLTSQSHPESRKLQPEMQQLQRASQALQAQAQGTGNTLLQTLPAATYQVRSLRTRKSSGLMSPISPTATAGRGTVGSPRKGNKSSLPLSPSPHSLKPSTRTTSISKARRTAKPPNRPNIRRSSTTGSSTTGARSDLTPPASKPYASGPPSSNGTSFSGQHPTHSHRRSFSSRWNLSADNVTEKLFNRRFHKIEADEVVTPGQVQQYRQSRIAKAEAQAEAEARRSSSVEILRSIAGGVADGNPSDTNLETPVEPFHLQDLPSRIENSASNSGGYPGVLSPVVEVPTPRSIEFEKKDTRQERTQLATPPPLTPPQPSSSNASYALSSASAPMVPATEGNVHVLPGSATFPDQSVKSQPPRRSTHKRGNSSSSRIPLLPSIPEVRITPHQGMTKEQQLGRRPSELHIDQTPPDPNAGLLFEEDAEYVFFKSTPYTGTMPAFQHGRIRLAKADLINAGTINSLESKLLTSPDEMLDWTAFHMAISGGAGELFNDPSAFLVREAEEQLVEDLCDWFEEIGLSADAPGMLVTKEMAVTPPPYYNPLQTAITSPPRSAKYASQNRSRGHQINASFSSFSSFSSSGSGSGSGSARSSGEIIEIPETVQVQSMPIPVTSEHPSGFWNTQPFDANRFFTGPGIKRWAPEGHPKRYHSSGIDVESANTLYHTGSNNRSAMAVAKRGRADDATSEREKPRDSMASLPQSPMLDLVMTTGVDGTKEYVPMGYNLGHDLGDFLKWETENVYAGGFFGAD